MCNYSTRIFPDWSSKQVKILHICLSNYFDENLEYQENKLVTEHAQMGHEVQVIASTQVFDDRGRVAYCRPVDKLLGHNVRLKRFPYWQILPMFMSRRVRYYPELAKAIEAFSPDIIIFHGSSALSLITVAQYIKRNPSKIFYIDSHADQINSGRTTISRILLHRLFYGSILRYALNFAGPLLCVSQSSMDFARDVYRVEKERLEFFPLGADIIDEDERDKRRAAMRDRLEVAAGEILIVQSGKFNVAKKLAVSLRAFSKVPELSARLIICGVLHDDVKDECQYLMSLDKRVEHVGWVSANELRDYLCAADIYLQPGTQSVSMQQSLACGCAVILDDIPGHRYYIRGNGWLVSNEADLVEVFRRLDLHVIEEMRGRSVDFANEYLDYRSLALRLLQV